MWPVAHGQMSPEGFAGIDQLPGLTTAASQDVTYSKMALLLDKLLYSLLTGRGQHRGYRQRQKQQLLQVPHLDFRPSKCGQEPICPRTLVVGGREFCSQRSLNLQDYTCSILLRWGGGS